MLIDNENETMGDVVNKSMAISNKIDIAVGYFFVSGFAQVLGSIERIESSSDPAS